jgi:hypothetical protein
MNTVILGILGGPEDDKGAVAAADEDIVNLVEFERLHDAGLIVAQVDDLLVLEAVLLRNNDVARAETEEEVLRELVHGDEVGPIVKGVLHILRAELH